MTASPRIHRLCGDALLPYLDEVARLRITVFRDWPYLYAGDMDYERDYLAAYAASPGSVCVLAFDGEAVIGAATGLPLADDAEAFHAPLREAGLSADEVFYFGESVLLPRYRGLGVGHAFFDQREAHARALGRFASTAFCAVDREPHDPRRPPDYRDHDDFWRRRGYARRDDLRMRLDWNEIGRGACTHTLTFWTRALEPAA